MQERSCYLEMSQKVAKSRTKKEYCPDAGTQRKAEQKKASACCPHSGISDTLKESPAAGECRGVPERPVLLPDCAKCAKVRTKKDCCRFRDFGGPKRDGSPRSGRPPGRSGGLDVEMSQKVAQKRMPAEWGTPAAGSPNRAKVCSKKRRSKRRIYKQNAGVFPCFSPKSGGDSKNPRL